MNYKRAAQQFVYEGFCHIPIYVGRVEEAQQAFKNLFSSLVPNEDAHGTRKGERDPDVGLIRKTKSLGGDDKWFFHVAADMKMWLSRHALTEFEKHREDLKVLSYFKRLARDEMMKISSSIENELDLASGTLSRSIMACSHNNMRYSVNTLRGLFYETGPEQTGAKPHIDRNLLTGHLGDEGGELQVMIDGNWQSVSPAPGQMLVFAGAKMLWLTEGRIPPLLHRSITHEGEDRRAMVFFSQADIGFYPHTAQEIVGEFYERNPEIQSAVS